MLSADKLKDVCGQRKMNAGQLAEKIARGGLDGKKAVAAVRNWQKGLFKPKPRRVDVDSIAEALGVEVNDLADWSSSYRYAPSSARKARLVARLIVGRTVQEAMDILKFTRKRTARMMEKVLKSAVASADEKQADVDNLFISRAFVNDAGVRIGTKRWIPKDRGRTQPIRKKACHIHVTVTQT